MWRLIFGSARELNVQIFVTTHSSDCIKSLAELCYADPQGAANVTLQRIGRARSKAVPYTGTEIPAAAEQQIAVRYISAGRSNPHPQLHDTHDPLPPVAALMRPPR